MQNIKRNHHIVPRYILRNFCDSKNTCYTLNKNTHLIKQLGVNVVCTRKNFYTIYTINNKGVINASDAAENNYAKREQLESHIISNIIKSCSAPIATGAEIVNPDSTRIILDNATVLQLLRGTSVRSYGRCIAQRILDDPQLHKYIYKFTQSNNMHNGMADKLMDILHKNILVQFTPLNPANSKHRLLEDVFESRSLIVLYNRTNCLFVTCDNPVLITDISNNKTGFGKAPLSDPHTIVYYPLSPRVCLCYIDLPVQNRYNNKILYLYDKNTVKHANIAAARQADTTVVGLRADEPRELIDQYDNYHQRVM